MHEAAHAVALVANYKVLRARIKYVSIVPGCRQVRTRQPMQYRTDEPRQIEAFIQVMLAGMAANVAYSRMGRIVALFGTGVEDWKLASEAAEWLDAADMEALSEDAILFVKRERAAIHGLADALLETGYLDGNEAEQLITKCRKFQGEAR